MEDIMYKDFVFRDTIVYIHNWTWQELLVGVEELIITMQMVVEYAKKIINEETTNYEMVINVIIAERCEEITESVERLAKEESLKDRKTILDKWRYAILLDLYFKREEYVNVYEQIALIAADFMHPKDMDSFIYYKPFDGTDMEINWINYLKEQSIRFEIDVSL